MENMKKFLEANGGLLREIQEGILVIIQPKQA